MLSIIKRYSRNLAWQILIALIMGVALGLYLHTFSDPSHPYYKTYQSWVINVLQPMGDIFIRLIKMIVLPIILSTLTLGIAGLGNSKSLGRLGGKTILYFEIITTIAIGVGLLFGNLFHPGSGIDISNLHHSNVSQYVQKVKHWPRSLMVWL